MAHETGAPPFVFFFFSIPFSIPNKYSGVSPCLIKMEELFIVMDEILWALHLDVVFVCRRFYLKMVS